MDSVTEDFCSTFHVALLECKQCTQVARHEEGFSHKGTKKRRRHKENLALCLGVSFVPWCEIFLRTFPEHRCVYLRNRLCIDFRMSMQRRLRRYTRSEEH